MRTLLLFPPGWGPHSPYLALPLLSAHLKAAGRHVEQFDANIAFFDRLLSAEYLRDAQARLRRRDDGASHRELLLLAPRLIEHIDAAKRGFRSYECFTDKLRYEWCRRIIGAALRLVEASRADLSLSLHKLANKALPADSSHNVLEAALRWDDNPVREFFAAAIAPRLQRGYDLIGMSVADRDQLVPALTIAAGIRRVAPDAKIVLGGNYLTRIARRWDTPHPFHDWMDFAVLGEGEEAIVGLVEALDGRGGLDGVPNLQYVTDGRLVNTPTRTVALERTPPPDFDDLPLDLYLSPGLVLPTYAGRSCPWNRCTFCTIADSSGSYRPRESGKIADEIAYLQHRHGTSLFTLVDESLPPGVVRKLADALDERRLDVQWYGEARLVPGFTEDTVARAARAGMRLLQFGLESYNQRVLDRIRKGVRVEHIRPLLERLLRHGVGFHLFCMIGFPGETYEEAQRTLSFSDEMLELARTEYGVAWCTKGVGTFGLERGSAVHAEPERYGVDLLPAGPDKDLAFDCAYTVAAGLDAASAAQLLDHYVGADIYAFIAARRGAGFPNRALAPDAAREEETFLAAVGARAPHAPGLHLNVASALPAAWLAWNDDPLPPWADCVADGDDGLLVDAYACRVTCMPPHHFTLALRARRGEPLAVEETDLLALYADRLGQAGEAEAEPQIVANELAELLFVGEAEAVLYDPLRERAMRLNLTGALLWLMLQAGRQTADELLHLAQRTFGSEMSMAQMHAFLGQLARHGMLARLPAGGHA